MATITNFLAKPPPYLTSLTKINPFNSDCSPYHLSFFTKPTQVVKRLESRPTVFVTKATAASGTKKADTDERVQRIHSIEEFDEALRMAKNKLVVVEYAATHSLQSSKIYPFMVDLSRTCSDVEFLLVMGDESEKTRELCEREKIDKVPHFSFYKSMEKIHEEEGIGPDQLMGDVLYYGDSHSAVAQLHCKEDVEKLIEDHKVDGKLIVLDVGLKHCGPCVKVYPTVIKLSRQMTDTVAFARMNGDENDSCMQFLKDMDVVEVPTFLFIRDGEICGRYVGSGKNRGDSARSSGLSLSSTVDSIVFFADEMMGLGSLGNGASSSSSSNLSALAAPFTVDRSNPKPNSNPLMHFTEPPYVVPFHSSFHDWQYLHSSACRPDLYSNLDSEVDSIGTTCLPSANDYRHLGSHTVSSRSTLMLPLNPNVSAATDTFTSVQYSSDIPSNHVEAKSYYPPFVSPVVDDDIPLVALNEPSFDLLSTSRIAPLDGPSQVGYTQSLSGLEYMPQWDSFWNRLADEVQGKQVELGRGVYTEETNNSGSYVYKDYMKQGADTAEGLSKCEEASAVSHRKCADSLSQFVSSSTGLNDESSSLQDPRFISSEFSRPSILGMSSTLLESHPPVSTLESATNFWNHQNPYSASYDKCFQSLDSCLNDHISVKKSSPAIVIRPPCSGTSTTLPNTVSSDANCIGNVAAINNKDFGCHNPSNQKEPLLPRSYGKEGCLDSSQTSLHVERSDPVVLASSFTVEEELSNKPATVEGLDHMSKTGMEFQLPDINIPDGFTSAHDTAEGFTSVEDYLESLDDFNPSVDSPCWKGARASRFSPSEVSEAATPQHFMKKLEVFNSLYPQQTQIFPPCTDVNVKVSSQNLCENSVYQENGYVELGSLLCPERLSNAYCPAREHSSTDAVKAGFNYPKPSSSNGVQFSHEFDKPRKEYNVPNNSKSDSDLKPSHTKQPDKGDFRSERVFKLCPVVVDTGLNANDATEDGSVKFHGVESTSCLPCSAEDVNKPAKLHVTESTPKINVQMLVNTIHNLSELLLFQCSNDASAVSEEDHEGLKHVINNLDACVSRKIEHRTQTRESMFTRKGASHKCKNLPDLHKGVIAGKPQVTKEVGASSHGSFDHHCIQEGKGNGNVFGKEVEKFPDCFRGYADSVRDNLVQAIKAVLKEAFNGEEEMQSEALLYKNLWLEAEAALCSISYRARFNRMKIEMEKSKSHKGKDVAESTMAVEKLLNSKVSPDPNITDKVTAEVKNRPVPENSIQDFPVSSIPKVVDDVEASALARFHILICRGENSNSVRTEGQRPAEEVGTGFAGKTNHWPFIGEQSEDGSLDVALGPHSQCPMPDNSIQDSPVSSIPKFVDDVEASALARFHILKCRGENSNSVSTEGQRLAEVVDTGLAGKTNHWPLIGGQSEDGSLDVTVGPYSQCPMPDNSIQDSPISGITKVGDDVEASALARFHILKCRGENLNCVSKEGQRPVEEVDTGFAGKTNHWPFIGDQSADGSLDVAGGLYPQYCSGNSKVDKFGSCAGGFDHQTMKEFCVCATDDQVIQSCKNKKLGSPLPSGWCDIFSSDWEHVMKDEFATQN